MKTAAILLAILLLGGCVSDAGQGGTPSASLGSTSSRRYKDTGDDDNPQKDRMCQDTSIGGESKTVCY